MARRYRNPLALVLAAVVTVGGAATGAGQTPSVDALTRSVTCNTHGGAFKDGEKVTARMTVGNDGGWCWTDGFVTPGKTHSYLAAKDLVLTDPPKHGHVVLGDMANHVIRTAYQPDPGYTGPDGFTIHYNVSEAEKTFNVTVSNRN